MRMSAGLLNISIVLLTLGQCLAGEPTSSPVPPAQRARILAAYGQIPLSFEANNGQTDARVKFVARSHGATLFLTPTEADWRYSGAGSSGLALRMKLIGANPRASLSGVGELVGRSNYLKGKDPSKWQTSVPHFARVEYRDVYPGVNMVYHGTQNQLEYDFVVAPGADASRIALQFDGAGRLGVEKTGDLVLHTALGDLRQKKPLVYQQRGEERQLVSGGYRVDGDRIRFALGKYDHRLPLIIDPLVYATFVGGTGSEDGEGMTVDAAGNAYITGAVGSSDFPTTPGAYLRALANPATGDEDAFVTKVNPSGTALIYSTYLGGELNDQGNSIVVDSAGNAYIAGKTESAFFPTTPGAYQTSPGVVAGTGLPIQNGFVAKLNSTGTGLLYSTYLHYQSGGNIYVTQLIGLGVVNGNAYVAGNIEQTPGGSVDVNDGYAAELNATGSALLYSYRFGGSADDEVESLFVDPQGNAYIAGETSSADFPVTAGAYQTAPGGDLDGFLLKLNPAGTAPVFSTFLGGVGTDTAEDVAVDAAGSIYVTGTTTGNFRTTAGAYQTTSGGGIDAYIVKLNPAGSAAFYSTYIGGNAEDHADALAVDAAGNVLMTGNTLSTNFPTTADAVQKSYGGGGGDGDGFILKLNASGTALMYSSYFGGTGNDFSDALALDSAGNAYITGATASPNFPVTPGAYKTTCGTDNNCNSDVNDMFVAKFDLTTGIAASVAAVSGGTQAGAPGSKLPAPLVIKVLDGHNTPVIGATVTFTTTNASVTPSSAVTDASGTVSTQVTLGGGLGPATVIASATGASTIFKFTAQLVNISAVVNGASFLTPLQDGSWTSILGTNLAPTTRTWNTQTEIINGVLPLSLDGVSVTIDGKPAPIYYISPSQLNVLTPITGKIGPVAVVVTTNAGIAAGTAVIAKYSPALFLFDPLGRKYPAALIARTDGGVDYLGPVGLFGSALPTRPAKPGEIIELYGTGFGPTNPPVSVGSVYTGAAPVDPPGAVTVTIGGANAPVLFAGITGAGLYQLNVVVPDLPSGDQKVILTVMGIQTPDNVFVAVTR